VTIPSSTGAHERAFYNALSELPEMSLWLQARLEHLGASAGAIHAFDLCANEAVANVILYAFPEGGSHRITLQLSGGGGRLCLQIRDDGIAYDPLSRPPHAAPADLESACIGGLGVDLIRAYMSECRYQRSVDTNILTLILDDADLLSTTSPSET
jgi:anti-sigma regulatory factor (Ser/Thr protein kinase)